MWALICAALIGIDQLIKWLSVTRLSQIDTYPIITDVFHLTYVENRGAAFGIFQNKIIFLVILTVVEIAIIMYFFIKKSNKKQILFRLSLICILAGAVGNFIDRLLRGFVVDMFDFRLINFYVFNFADACICIGAALLFYYIIFLHDKQEAGGKIGA